jgi:hypothetical protein
MENKEEKREIELRKRINILLDRKGKTINSIAADPTEQRKLNRHIKEGKTISSGTILKLFDYFPQLNAEWLLKGKGGMELPKENENTELPKENGGYIPKYNSNLLQHYTKAEGLIGILNDMELKFSKIEKSNDIKERRLWAHDELKDLKQEEKKEEAKKYKYISFSIKDENREVRQPKMYDLYAGLHTGACIEFSKEKLDALNRHLGIDFCEVTYDSYSLNQQKTIRDELKHKYYQWRDEKECRIIYHGDVDKIYINKDCIKRIYLGLDFFNDKIKVAEFCNVVEEKDIAIEKITQVGVGSLAHLVSRSDKNSPCITQTGIQAAGLIPYFSDKYKTRHSITDDRPQIKINYIEEKYYQQKYYALLEENREINKKYIMSIEEKDRLKDQIIALMETEKKSARGDSDASDAHEKPAI